MSKIRAPEQTRLSLLDAAADLLKTQGAALSLDAVARHAGISKGGLLHHFPSREALLAALALHLLAEFEAKVTEAHQQEGHGPGAWARAYIRVSFSPNAAEDALFAALSALAVHPDVLAAWAGSQGRLAAQAEADGLPLGRAHAIRLACDGLCLNRLTPPQRDALHEELLSWTQ